jgi:hypothetical protein
MLLKLWATPLASWPTQAKRALEPCGQFGCFDLVLLALENVSNHVSREAHRGAWEIKAARRPKPVESENASIIARLLQHDARPGANSEAEQRLPCVAKRESRDVGRGNDAEPDLLELARQGESPLRPPRG